MQPKNKIILVTGGAGFVGSNLVEILENDNDVIILDNFSNSSKEMIQPLLKENVKLIEGDIVDYNLVRQIIKELSPEYVVHLAAHVGIEKSVKEPLKNLEVNILGTFNVLQASLDSNIKKVVYISSGGAVYGDPLYLPTDENHPLNPKSPYGVSKLTGEKYCQAFFHSYGLKYIILRPFNIFGPRSRKGAIYTFITSILKNQPITIFGNGEQKRDFVYVKNVVNGILLALSSHIHNDIFNIATGKGTSVNEVVKILMEKLHKVKIFYLPKRNMEIEESIANIEKARRVLCYEPHYSLEDGLYETIKWVKEYEGYT